MRLYFRGLHARVVVGVTEEERRERQDIHIDVDVWTDDETATRTDRFADTIDYRALKKDVFYVVESNRYNLVEAMAGQIADLALKDPRVTAVRVRVEKPTALRFARTVGVELERRRS